MAPPRKIRRNPPPPEPITTTPHSAHHRETKWRYHRWAAQHDRLDEEIRLVMSGGRHEIKRLQRLHEECTLRYEALLHYLYETTRRIRIEKATAAPDDCEFAEYLDTAAQKIARAATTEKLKI